MQAGLRRRRSRGANSAWCAQDYGQRPPGADEGPQGARAEEEGGGQGELELPGSERATNGGSGGLHWRGRRREEGGGEAANPKQNNSLRRRGVAAVVLSSTHCWVHAHAGTIVVTDNRHGLLTLSAAHHVHAAEGAASPASASLFPTGSLPSFSPWTGFPRPLYQ